MELKENKNVFIPNWDNKPIERKPLILLNGVSILTHQNLTSIIAAPGLGKSSVCEAICSALLNAESDSLGFELSNEIQSILYIDNERTMIDVWNSFYRMTQRANVSETDKVIIVGLRMVARLTERLSTIENLITEHSADLVLIDGAGDLVSDTNSLENATECRIWLRELTNKYNCSILTTLHPNKGTLNPRGHIGSEVLRESENVLAIENNNGVRTLTTDFLHGKARNGGNCQSSFKWDIDKSMFVSCELVESTKRKLTPYERFSDAEIIAILKKVFISGALNKKDTHTGLMASLGVYDNITKGRDAVSIFLTQLEQFEYIESVKVGTSNLLNIHPRFTLV